MFNVVNKNVSKSMSITFLSSFKPNPRHIKFPLFSLMEQCSLWVWKNLLSLWSWIILSSKHQNSTRTATNWNQKSLCVFSSLNIFCECFCLLFIKKLQKVSKSFKKFSNVVVRISTFEKWEKFESQREGGKREKYPRENWNKQKNNKAFFGSTIN